jgi:glycosyltransferase involved in cell wall biosynthesis
MDHGNVTLPFNPVYWAQRQRAILKQPLLRRLTSQVRLAIYAPSLRFLIRYATRRADRFLVAGDEVEEIYRRHFAVDPGRIIRYPYMVDSDRYTPLGDAERERMRAEYGFAADTIVIAIINRLAPEKGMAIALKGIADATARLPGSLSSRIRVVIAGDGPERQAVEADIQRLGLADVCALVGVASPEQVAALLGASDIFLYTGMRGTNYSVAVLEAMAAACAVVATTEPRSNARLLAEGRGIAIAPDHPELVTNALVALLADLLGCQRMGHLARAYVRTSHSADALRQCLLRATQWAPNVADMVLAAEQLQPVGDVEGNR